MLAQFVALRSRPWRSLAWPACFGSGVGKEEAWLDIVAEPTCSVGTHHRTRQQITDAPQTTEIQVLVTMPGVRSSGGPFSIRRPLAFPLGTARGAPRRDAPSLPPTCCSRPLPTSTCAASPLATSCTGKSKSVVFYGLIGPTIVVLAPSLLIAGRCVSSFVDIVVLAPGLGSILSC